MLEYKIVFFGKLEIYIKSFKMFICNFVYTYIITLITNKNNMRNKTINDFTIHVQLQLQPHI